MRRLTSTLSALVLLALPTLARAADATGPLVCTLVDVFDCSETDCTEVESEVVGVPDLVRLDAKKKILTALDVEFDGDATALEAVTSEGGKISARGQEGDRSLTLVVEGKSGDAMMTVSGHKLVLVAYGECAKH
jgi:hypothetical protein